MLRSQQVETSRSKAILEAVADGVLVTDANLEITLFNASAENIFNLDRTQVIGLPLDGRKEHDSIFGPAAQAWMETIQTWTQDPESYQSGDSYAEQFTLENGRVISVHLAPVSLRTGPSPAEDFLGTVSIFQDITHQVEVDRLKSEFVATVSHELRTPMTSIKGYVEILLMGAAGTLSSQQAQFLDIVNANTERLSTLVNDLLNISGIESGRIALSMQPINLNELAAEAVADLSRRIQEQDKHIKIEKDWPADLPSILGDFDRVREIFDNLLDNAYKYNVPNGRISLHMRAAGEEVQIDVQDTGMGIPDREQPRLFERFYRGDSPLVLNVAGTGLGLSIVKSLVEMHGGRIWLASTGVHGEGSTFSFTLSVVPTNGNDAVEKVTRVAEQSPEHSYQASSFILHP
jgi:PAS domain S-box-containing protein